jgi:hypothetical protein
MGSLRLVLVLTLAALLFQANPAPGIDSVVQGAVAEVEFGTNAAGDAVMGDLGGAWAGIRSDAAGRWLLEWDLRIAARVGYLAGAIPGNFLVGGHGFAWTEFGYRTAASSPWSPYVGGHLGGDLRVMVHPGLSLSALDTVNNMDGVGGLVASGAGGLDAGVSWLSSGRSLRLVVIAQESLRAPGTYTPGFAFTDVGFGARYDVEQSITLSVEAFLGWAPARHDGALGITDQTSRRFAQAGFRNVFDNGMWLGVGAFVERILDRITYPSGTRFSTGDAPTVGVTVSFGMPLWQGAK